MRGIGIGLNSDFSMKIEMHRDSSGKIVQGVVLEKTLPQNQSLILVMQPGELKENPLIGCGIEDIMLDTNPLLWRRKIKMQMEADGQDVKSVSFAENKLTIDGEYNS